MEESLQQVTDSITWIMTVMFWVTVLIPIAGVPAYAIWVEIKKCIHEERTGAPWPWK